MTEQKGKFMQWQCNTDNEKNDNKRGDGEF